MYLKKRDLNWLHIPMNRRRSDRNRIADPFGARTRASSVFEVGGKSVCLQVQIP